jgi:hypothetical protein
LTAYLDWEFFPILVLNPKINHAIECPGNFSFELLHLCANRINLPISRAVRALRRSFSTRFSTQLLKSPSQLHGIGFTICAQGVKLKIPEFVAPDQSYG